MGHALLLELSEEIYQPLVKTAQQSGDTPEQVATNWLVAVIRQTRQDPLEKFIGVFRSDIFDWSDCSRNVKPTGMGNRKNFVSDKSEHLV